MSPSILRNLTSEQWELLSGLIPAAKKGGRKRSVDMEAVVNAIFYILCAGCAWRMLPHDFPALENRLPLFPAVAPSTAHGNKFMNAYGQWVRVSQNREPSPSEVIMDSQSVETATMVSKEVGYDSGKKITRTQATHTD